VERIPGFVTIGYIYVLKLVYGKIQHHWHAFINKIFRSLHETS